MVPSWSRLWAVTISCWTRATSCLPCARVKPRSAISPRSPGRSIAITSTLRLAPSTPVSTRRKTHPILDPQPAKNSAGHTLITTAPPIARQSLDDEWQFGQFIVALLGSQNGPGNLSSAGGFGKLPRDLTEPRLALANRFSKWTWQPSADGAFGNLP